MNRQLVKLSTGKVFACTIVGFFDAWNWIRETVADEFECSVDDVDCIETDDGDLITVLGVPVARSEEWVTRPSRSLPMAA